MVPVRFRVRDCGGRGKRGEFAGFRGIIVEGGSLTRTDG